MAFPVKLELYKNGCLIGQFVAQDEDGLSRPIEMDTGTGWLDASSLYQALLDKGCDQVTDSFRVCHSFEKWGSLQQEVVRIKVRLTRLPCN
jgi:hypothetical protein